jgi:O-antigen ligase
MQYFKWDEVRGRPFSEQAAQVVNKYRSAARGQMAAAALRAWKTAPVFGIGPGMHQNVWFHFAPTPDGDRERGIRPTRTNIDFHSYEVHNDWLQLLEEYGIVGFALFAAAAGAVLAGLLAAFCRESRARRDNAWRDTGRDSQAMVLAALFSCAAMAFHSLGDFNLQMPATAWMFAAIVAVALALVLRTDGEPSWMREFET